MKKILSFLGLLAVLSMATPVMAAPPGSPGHGPRGPHNGGHIVNAGHRHRHHMAPIHHHSHRHGGIIIHTGHYPRHSYWHGYRHGYWGSPWCDYRLGCCPYPGFGLHVPMGGASFSVRF